MIEFFRNFLLYYYAIDKMLSVAICAVTIIIFIIMFIAAGKRH